MKHQMRDQREVGSVPTFVWVIIMMVVFLGSGATTYLVAKARDIKPAPAASTAKNAVTSPSQSVKKVDSTGQSVSNQSTAQLNTQRAEAQAAAMMVQKKAEAYDAINSNYPRTLADFNTDQNTTLAGSGVTPTAAIPTSGTDPYYQYCSDTGAQVFYFDPVAKTATIIALGDASSDASCK